MLDFRVDTFLAVCKYMNFTRAAEALNITQPAVSQHIRFLEREYGIRLFMQEGKKIDLTGEGKILLNAMRRIKNDEKRLKSSFQSLISKQRTIYFGVTMTIGEYALAGALSSFLQLYPEQNLHVVYGNTTQLLQNLHEGEIDFALVEGYFSEEEYETEILSTEEFIPACAVNHRFFQKPQKLRDLFFERLIIRERGSGTRNILERSLALQNFGISDFSYFIEVENMHTIIELLKKDCGITFLYKTAIEKELREKSLKQIYLSDFTMKHDFTFIWEKKSIFSDDNRKLCLTLKNLSR